MGCLLAFYYLFELLLSAVVRVGIGWRCLVFVLVYLFQLLRSESVFDHWADEGICNSPLNVFGLEVPLKLLGHCDCWLGST